MLKKISPFILLFSYTVSAHADDATALALAQQAGIIAGAAQACGQDISLLNNRIIEAIQALSNNDTTRNQALVFYTQSVNNADQQQQSSHKLDCSQVKKDYQNLPILRNDYQQSVMEPLKQTAQTQVTPEQAKTIHSAVGNQSALPGTTMTSGTIQPLGTPSMMGISSATESLPNMANTSSLPPNPSNPLPTTTNPAATQQAINPSLVPGG